MLQQVDQTLIQQIRASIPRPSMGEAQISLLTASELDATTAVLPTVTTPGSTAVDTTASQRARTARGRRRSSIPDLLSEAKRIVWGGSRLKTPPAVVGAPLPERPASAARIERRPTFKQHQTCDLPDVAEEATIELDADRRHSLDIEPPAATSRRRLSAQRPDRLTIITDDSSPRRPSQPSLDDISAWWSSLGPTARPR